MTGLIVFTAIILLLVLALEPAHRRQGSGPARTGQLGVDRDQQRLLADLRARTPRRDPAPRRHLSLPHLGRHSAAGAHGHRA